MAVTEKGNLTNINRCTPEVFDRIVNGTHATETYDDNALYEVVLDDPAIIGLPGSGLSIDANNNIVIDNPVPAPSDTGTYVLKSINGVLTWVAE